MQTIAIIVFQYPLADRRRCNNLTRWTALNLFGCFSILLRIVGDVTCVGSSQRIAHQAFQYPLADRRRCNIRCETAHAEREWFQYPLADRRRCNHRLALADEGTQQMFQYPLADRRRCNARLLSQGPRHSRKFQYPLADRRRCNRIGAVPTAQRAVFQYPLADRRRCNAEGRALPTALPWRFSILLRIVGDVTSPRQAIAGAA